MTVRSIKPWIVALLLVLALQTLAVACPSCKESLDASDPQRANLVQGFFYSIIFMLSMPFLIFTSLCAYFYYEVCKARRLKGKQSAIAPLTGTMRQVPTS